ncbi:MAG: aminopeptidase [Deltaproteobacteria bacterium]|nr:aminopeptidase [Deltaproteobacteria bacterium]
MQRKSSRVLLLLGALLVLAACEGCYYGHLAVGQTRLLMAREPMDEALARPDLDPKLRGQLALVGEARKFAAELGLEVGKQYTSYVDWPGDRVITTVVATEPGSVEAAGFRFPIIGEVPYKGFFDQERAKREADSLRAEGMDVCVAAVPAYSTLGWLADPVTTPMLQSSDGRLVQTVIHELVHATVFVKSLPDFNEGVASFIGEEASVRFFGSRDAGEAARQRARVDDDRAVAATLLRTRERIARLYADEPASPERDARRLAIDEEARAELASLPLTTHDAPRLAERVRLNDACLALRGAYRSETAVLDAVLDDLDGDLRAFIERLREAAQSDDPRAAFLAGIPGP